MEVILGGGNILNIWMMVQERFIHISVFSVILIASLLLLWTTWKNRQTLPKALTLFSSMICFVLVLISMYALIFVVSFGYNA